MNSIEKWVQILGVGNPVSGAPKIWNSSTLNSSTTSTRTPLSHFPPHKWPLPPPQTISSIPKCEKRIQADGKIAKTKQLLNTFFPLSLFTKSTKILWIWECLKFWRDIRIRSNTCQTNVKFRTLSSKVVKCVMRKHKLSYCISVCWTNRISKEIQK